MSAVKKLKTVISEAEEKFDLVDDLSNIEVSQKALSIKPAIELKIAEELMKSIQASETFYDEWLGFADGDTTKLGAFEWEIKVDFLEYLSNKKILSSVTSEEIWDEDICSWIAIKRVNINPAKQDDLQIETNRLVEKVKKTGAVKLVENKLSFDAKTGQLKFGKKLFTIGDSYSHRLVEHMFNVEPGAIVETADLYKFVFDEQLSAPNDGPNAKEGRNVQVKRLRNKKWHINERVKTEFNTADDLIYSRGFYRRDY